MRIVNSGNHFRTQRPSLVVCAVIARTRRESDITEMLSEQIDSEYVSQSRRKYFKSCFVSCRKTKIRVSAIHTILRVSLGHFQTHRIFRCPWRLKWFKKTSLSEDGGDALDRSVVDPEGQIRVEQHFRAPRNVRRDNNDVSVWELVCGWS